MDQTYMKQRKILPLVLAMSCPMMLSMAVGALYNVVDSFFVSQIDEKAMTALSLLYPIQNLSHAVVVGFGIGINAVVAFALGAGNPKQANQVTSMGFVLSLLHGVLLSILCIFSMNHFLKLFTSDGQVLEYGMKYTRIVFLFAAVDCAGVFLEKVIQAVGRMKTSMTTMMAGCIVNIILDPLMIYGMGPFPRMGIEGAAWATGIGQIVTFVLNMAVCMMAAMPVRIRRKDMVWDTSSMKKVYSIGSAATLNLALPSVQVSVLNGILSGFGGSYVFVLGVYYKLQMFLYLSANGIVQGIRPLVGYNFGAGEKHRVKRIYQISLSLIAVIMLAGTLLCISLPGQIMGIFTSDPQILAIGVKALRIISIGFVVSAISVTTSGALEGMGKGFPSLVTSLVRYLVVVLPLAFLLSRFLGGEGVWHAFWITEFISGGIACLFYKKYFT